MNAEEIPQFMDRDTEIREAFSIFDKDGNHKISGNL